MSHNVSLDLADTHYHQHSSSSPSFTSKFIPSSRHHNHSSSSNLPSKFHSLLILFKRIFCSYRCPRFRRLYLPLFILCILAFLLFYNYSLESDPTTHGTGGSVIKKYQQKLAKHQSQLSSEKSSQYQVSKSNIEHDRHTEQSASSNDTITTTMLSNNEFVFPREKFYPPQKPRDSKARFRPVIGRVKSNNDLIDNGTIAQEESNIHSSQLSDHLLPPNYLQKDPTPLNPPRLVYTGQPIAMSPPSISSSSMLSPAHPTKPLTARDFESRQLNKDQLDIKEAMRHSWNNYKRYAWGYDMLMPRAKRPDHWFNLGLTIVDSVDTLIMMDLQDDSNEALDWIETKLNFDTSNKNSNCFELTIRILGGLLSAYHLRPERTRIVEKAEDLGDRLLHCYDTASGVIPNSDIDLAVSQSHAPSWYPYSSLSEVSSIQLEFRDLSRLTEQLNFERTTFMTSLHLHNLTKKHESSLLAMYIDPSNGKMENSMITLGARADSYYEYLLKQYLQTDIEWLQDDYLGAIEEIRDQLLKITNGEMNLTFVAEVQKYRTVDGPEDLDYQNKMDHLVCFLPGTLILGYYHFSPKAKHLRSRYDLHTPEEKLNSRYDHHLDMAESIARTCYMMYNSTATGLSPEIAFFGSKDDKSELIIQTSSAHNILRPEFVESLFYLYHITGKKAYREQARQVFDSFVKNCRVPGGFSPISDVRKLDYDANLYSAPDRMESFWMSETLKYLYLIFCDDEAIISRLLNDYVFNTEAHLIPRSYSRLGLRAPF